MNPRQVLERYGIAINTHDFDRLVDLLDPECTFYFSTGTHRGVDEARAAFERVWGIIANEVYTLSEVVWIAESDTVAACTYVFHWSGEIDGTPREGGGRGTSVFTKRQGNWRLVHEHLSGFPAP